MAILTLNNFLGGLNTKLAPHLLANNQAVIASNLPLDDGTLRPLLALGTGVTIAATVSMIKWQAAWYGSATAKSYSADEFWLYSADGGIPRKTNKNGTVTRLGMFNNGTVAVNGTGTTTGSCVVASEEFTYLMTLFSEGNGLESRPSTPVTLKNGPGGITNGFVGTLKTTIAGDSTDATVVFSTAYDISALNGAGMAIQIGTEIITGTLTAGALANGVYPNTLSTITRAANGSIVQPHVAGDIVTRAFSAINLTASTSKDSNVSHVRIYKLVLGDYRLVSQVLNSTTAGTVSCQDIKTDAQLLDAETLATDEDYNPIFVNTTQIAGEQVVNGTFPVDASGPTAGSGVTIAWVSANRVRVTGVNGFESATYSFPTVIGNTYRVSVEMIAKSHDWYFTHRVGAGSYVTLSSAASPGVYTYDIVAAQNPTVIGINPSGNVAATLDFGNVSFKPLASPADTILHTENASIVKAGYIITLEDADTSTTVHEDETNTRTATVSSVDTALNQITLSAALGGTHTFLSGARIAVYPNKLGQLWNGMLPFWQGSTLGLSQVGNPNFSNPLWRLDFSGPIKAVCSLSSLLVVLCEDGIYTVNGSDPSTVSRYRVPASVGCKDGGSAVVSSYGVLYLASDGIHLFDGTSTPLVSKSLIKSTFTGLTGIHAAYHDQQYILFHSTGSIIGNFQSGEPVWSTSTQTGISSFRSDLDDVLYVGKADNKVYPWAAGASLAWEWKTGSLADLSSEKVLENVTLDSIGDGSIGFILDGTLKYTKTFTGATRTFQRFKLPDYHGKRLELDIKGIVNDTPNPGTVYEIGIEFSAGRAR